MAGTTTTTTYLASAIGNNVRVYLHTERKVRSHQKYGLPKTYEEIISTCEQIKQRCMSLPGLNSGLLLDGAGATANAENARE